MASPDGEPARSLYEGLVQPPETPAVIATPGMAPNSGGAPATEGGEPAADGTPGWSHWTEAGQFTDLSLIHISEPTRPY